MDERYLPLLFEEMFEVGKAGTKVMRFGPEHKYPDDHQEFGGRTNQEALALEVGDLLEVCKHLGLSKQLIREGMKNKRAKLKKWGPDTPVGRREAS